jgi:tRNA(Arg) A34 adenosine deaminase TadA
MMSQKHTRFIQLAAEECEKSNMLMRHGCVAVINGRIVGTGYNNYRNKTSDGFVSKGQCTCHAEMAALRNVYKKSCSQFSNAHGKWMDNLKVAKVPEFI